jgi:two-component system, cell cycle response regulator
MNNNKVFRVAVIAELNDKEWRLLRSAGCLTTSRPRTYVFGPVTDERADIYLVDNDWPEAQDIWYKTRLKHQAPAIFFVSADQSGESKREFKRPIAPSSLLNLILQLDELTIQELHYLPEFSIGQEDTSLTVPITIKSKGSKYSALVVDDSPTVRAQVGLGLKMAGVAADFAESAEQAMTLLHSKDYDIAFLDVVLPGLDGYHVCRAIRKDRDRKHMSVIMLTSKSSAIDRVKASLSGCDAFLTKPVENEVFQQLLHKYLKEPDSVQLGEPLTAK